MTNFHENKLLELRSRLDGIRQHLELKVPVDSPDFDQAVISACHDRVDTLVNGSRARTGEGILSHVAAQLQVHFEEVRGEADITALEKKYLHEKREIGFGQLEIELNAPGVDAILFQRMRAPDYADDRWVAVLNLREGESRAYWSRAHELTHRIAEPPQYRLPFYRHRDDKADRLEALIDKTAAELAFYPTLFRPIIDCISTDTLSWELVGRVRELYAPSASRHATANGVLRFWPHPAFLLKARIAGRKRRPGVDRALRIKLMGFSSGAPNTLFFYSNMRVPSGSLVQHCFQSGAYTRGYEKLGNWTTSSGKALPDVRAFISVYKWRDAVFALISPLV